MAIAKVVQKFSIKEQPKDAAYWRTRPYAERLEALEQIRREYHQWKYGAEPRLHRVCRIVKRRFPECKVESPKWHLPKKKADVEKLPEALQEEVSDFVEYLLMKAGQRENKEWFTGSLSTAMQGMENEGGPQYTEADLKEIFHSDGFLLAWP